jgi:hypothetical protein
LLLNARPQPGERPAAQPHLRVTYPPAPPIFPPSALPPRPPVPPAAQSQPPQPSRPPLPCPQRALEWAVSHLPAAQRAEVRWAFEETLRFRAGNDHPSSLEGKQPIGRERFGLAGEELIPEGGRQLLKGDDSMGWFVAGERGLATQDRGFCGRRPGSRDLQSPGCLLCCLGAYKWRRGKQKAEGDAPNWGCRPLRVCFLLRGSA